MRTFYVFSQGEHYEVLMPEGSTSVDAAASFVAEMRRRSDLQWDWTGQYSVAVSVTHPQDAVSTSPLPDWFWYKNSRLYSMVGTPGHSMTATDILVKVVIGEEPVEPAHIPWEELRAEAVARLKNSMTATERAAREARFDKRMAAINARLGLS